METIGWILFLLPLGLGVYAYGAYPLVLRLLAAVRAPWTLPDEPDEWPTITVSLPAYNEADVIRGTLEAIVNADYPAEKRRVVVVSDASEDGTDDIVRDFTDDGVELVRLDRRRGKTAAENTAAAHLDGEITVNMDASIRIPPGSLKGLVRALEDSGVGVASGRDVSVSPGDDEVNKAESGYVGYEMWVRSLETRVGSIVGASGCFYAIRTSLHRKPIPPGLSRDFAAALTAREEGYRSVSVDEAVCFVPRTESLGGEFRRKARTMARGLSTLFFKRKLLNPFQYGSFALMLFSHKLCRWLVSLTAPLGIVGAAILIRGWFGPAALASFVGLLGTAGLLATVGEGRRFSAVTSACRYLVYSVAAGGLAWIQVFRGSELATWEPTRRENVEA